MKNLKSSMLAQIRAYVNFQDLSEKQAKELQYLRYLSLILVDIASSDTILDKSDLQTTIKSNLSRVLKPSMWKSMTCPRVRIIDLAGIRQIAVSFWALKKSNGKDPSEGEGKQPFRVGNVTFAQIRSA